MGGGGGMWGAIVGGIVGFLIGGPAGFVIAGTLIGAACGYGLGALAGMFMGATPGDFSVPGSDAYDEFGPPSNTISNKTPVKVVLGRYKVYGNIVWQSDPGSTVQQIVKLCQGPVYSITDIRFNDQPYTDFPGCSVTAYLGNGSQVADSRVGSLEGMNLRYYAYLAVTLSSSDKLSGSVKISCIVHGELVETFNSATGLWSGATWSENPAALIRHVLKNKRWGVGKDTSELMDDQWGAAFDFCNEPVDNGSGGTEARFRLNYILDAQKPAVEHIDQMLAVMRGCRIDEGARIGVHINKKEPVTFNFGDGSSFDPNNYNNIETNSFRWSLGSIEDNPNQVILHWIDPDMDYNDNPIVRDNRIDQQKSGKIVPLEITLNGIQYQSQARREIKYHVQVLRFNKIRVSWTGFLDARHLRIGQVVSLSCKAALFTAKQFRLVEISLQPEGRILFTGVEYNEGLYDDRMASSIHLTPQPDGPNIFAPLDDVTGLTVEEYGYQQGRSGGKGDGSHIANIDLSWTAISNDQLLRLRVYKIEVTDGSGATSQFLAEKSATSFRIPDVRVGITYTVTVKTQSDSGVFSTGVSGSITITGKDNPPSNVVDFDVYQEGGVLQFTWTPITDVDADLYEIRKLTGAGTWSAGVLIGSSRSNEFLTPVGEVGTITFALKAVDSFGNYSEVPALDTITVVPPPDRNFINTVDLFSSNIIQHAVLSGMQLVQSTLYDEFSARPALALQTAVTWEQRQSEGLTWESLQSSGHLDMDTTFVTSGSMRMLLTDAFDLETIFLFGITTDVDYNDGGNGTITTMINYSVDGATWSGWEEVDYAAQYRARYVAFGFDVASTVAAKPVCIYGAQIYIQAPTAMVDWGGDIAVPIGGKVVLFGAAFTTPPALRVCITNGVTGIPVVTKTVSSFTVKCYNLAGVEIDTAEVDYEARGY